MNSRDKTKRILIVAGETSGDVYASSLIDVLKSQANIEIFAVGGPQTASRDVKLLYDSSNWAAIGIIEAIKQAPKLLVILRSLKKFMSETRPDLLLLVDYPGFNMRLVKKAAALGIPTLYYFPPSKFAIDPKDVTDAAKYITRVAANFSFTYEVYKAAGANVEFVGHPLRDQAKPTMSREQAFKQFGLNPERPVIGLCPGSRKSELDQLLPVMLEGARLLYRERPDLQFLVPVAATETEQVFGVSKRRLRRQLTNSEIPIRLIEGRIYDVMSIASLLLICSGTATLEASHIGTPMVICYKVSLFTEIMARLFYRLPDYIGLPNIILNRMAIPELIQQDFTPEKLARKALEIIASEEQANKQRDDLKEVVAHLGDCGAHNRVASMALELVKKP